MKPSAHWNPCRSDPRHLSLHRGPAGADRCLPFRVHKSEEAGHYLVAARSEREREGGFKSAGMRVALWF